MSLFSRSRSQSEAAAYLRELIEPTRSPEPILYRVVAWLGARLASVLRDHVIPRIPIPARAVLVVGSALPVLGTFLHGSAPRLWPLVLPIGGALAFGSWWRMRPAGVFSVPGLRRARIPRRWLLPAAFLSVSVWLMGTWGMGPRTGLLDVLIAGMAIVFPIAWVKSSSRRPRSGRTEPMIPDPDPNQLIAEWPERITARREVASVLKGSEAQLWHQTAVLWEVLVQLPPGTTFEDVVPITPALESVLDLRRGALRVAPHKAARFIWIRGVRRDLLAEATPWPGPTRDTVVGALPLGPFEDGAVAALPLVSKPAWGVSVLVAGLPGSGKSNLLNVIVAALAGCRDVVLLGIDPQGTELGPWEPVFERLVLETGSKIEALLTDLMAVMDARTKFLRRQKRRAWLPSPDTPEIVLIVDEAARLDPSSIELIAQLAAGGRKAGIHIVLATQRPTARALGEWGAELKALLGASVCLRVANQQEANIVLGPGAAGQGWRPDRILDAKGSFLISSPDPEHAHPRRARGYLLTDDDVARWVPPLTARRPRLDDLSAARLSPQATA